MGQVSRRITAYTFGIIPYALCVIGGGVMRAGNGDMLTTNGLNIVDSAGVVRCKIGVGDAGESMLSLYDSKGDRGFMVELSDGDIRRVRARTFQNDGASGIEILDEVGGHHGDVRVLRFYTEYGEEAITLGRTIVQEGSTLVLRDPRSGSKVALGLERFGYQPYALLRGGVLPVVSADSPVKGMAIEPHIRLDMGAGGERNLHMQVDRDGAPVIEMVGREGRRRQL